MIEPKINSTGVIVLKWVILCLLVGLLIMAAIPNFIKPRVHYAENACVNNLRQIQIASEEFASEHNVTNGTPIDFPSDLTPYIKTNTAWKNYACPADGVYSIKKVGDKPICSLGTTVTPPHVLP
jgi:hypothetical protein